MQKLNDLSRSVTALEPDGTACDTKRQWLAATPALHA